IDIFETVTNKNVKVYKYLITSFASNAYDPYTAEENTKIFVDYLPNTSQDIVNFQSANYTKNPIYCKADASLQSAALQMTEHKIGCIIVVDNSKDPLGIITSSDIKNKIATGLFPITTPVVNIMSSPVISEKKNLSFADAQLKMIKHSIGHLFITEVGTSNSKLIGVLTNHDIIATLGNNPTAILKDIKRATRTKALRTARRQANGLLKSYLEQNIPVAHIANIISQINDAVTMKAIDIALEKMPTPPPVTFSWLALGSQGRKEQLLFSDQDNALIFEDVPADKYEETQNYFLELAKLVNKSLNKVGFEYCEADMMAKNPAWCRSISEWKAQFRDWILNTDEKAILLSSIFFDFSHIYGNQQLEKELTDAIYKTLSGSSVFFRFLGRDAL